MVGLTEKQVHVVMLPFPAFGHMNPFLDLSVALAKSGIHVSYISTPRNILRLPKIPKHLSHLIDFVSLPFPKLNPNLLPENAEATTDVPKEQMEAIKMAIDLLQEPVKNFIAKKQPDWIITDFLHHWAVDIAQDLNIPLLTFFVFSASTVVFWHTPEFIAGEGKRVARPTPKHLTVPPDWVDFPSKVACRPHEAIDMFDLLYVPDSSGTTSAERKCKVVQSSQSIVMRSSMEYEGEYIKLFSRLSGKPIFPVGLLPPEPDESSQSKANKIIGEEPWRGVFEWLDKQPANSVVFVGFGTEVKFKKEQIQEIARGVELSGLPFVWVLRRPEWAIDDADALPPGFATRTASRGVVQMGWAPQREILAHPSIGGSLFHAGWGTIAENLVHEHRLVALPFFADQPLNARLLVEKGLGLEVDREEDGSFSGEDIAATVKRAMESSEGERLKARAKEAAEKLYRNKQVNDNYVSKFVEYLKFETSCKSKGA